MATIKTLTKNKAQDTLIIDTNLINKEEVFRMLALAQATKLPTLLIGAPGTGKTKTVIDYARAFLMQNVDPRDTAAVLSAKMNFMEKIFILETDEGTKSSEIKGMPNLGELFTNNKYELSAPITEAEVIIINEVDKASAGIRNSLLGIMNERFLFNGKLKIPCKWKLFIATCNEIPKEELGSPFWDRFVLKTQVNRISAGDMVKYFEKGGKDYRESFSISIPNKDEMDTTVVSVNKLQKYLEVAYNKSSDRSLTFVPTLAKAVSFIWNISVDKSLIKIADLMVDNSASRDLQDKLMSPELKALISKVDMIYSIHDNAQINATLSEIEALVVGYAAKGTIDQSQVDDIETSIQYILANHPSRQEVDLDEFDDDTLTQAAINNVTSDSAMAMHLSKMTSAAWQNNMISASPADLPF